MGSSFCSAREGGADFILSPPVHWLCFTGWWAQFVPTPFLEICFLGDVRVSSCSASAVGAECGFVVSGLCATGRERYLLAPNPNTPTHSPSLKLYNLLITNDLVDAKGQILLLVTPAILRVTPSKNRARLQQEHKTLADNGNLRCILPAPP